MSANDRQVGGEHYKSEYQHWDYALKVRMGPLEYASTKYVARYRGKNGVLDLRKAQHYLEKLIEWAQANRQNLPHTMSARAMIAAETARFALVNKLDASQYSYTFMLASWKVVEELELAADLLKMLIESAATAATPVPLTEENHHAERSVVDAGGGHVYKYYRGFPAEGTIGSPMVPRYTPE